MIEFKKNVEKVLPYDRRQYREFWNDDFDSPAEWYGVTFQFHGAGQGKEIGLTEFVEIYEGLFKNVVLKLDNGSFWIVNHDDEDREWFPNDEDNLTHLRTLFKQNKLTTNVVKFTKFSLRH